MYVGIDIGGTKTLVAALNDEGVIVEKYKFPTSKNYGEFIEALPAAIAKLGDQQYSAGCVAVPGRLDRPKGRIVRLGNLPWEDAPIVADCEKIAACPITFENDANLAALSESMLHTDKDKVFYVTVSTGIGTGIVYKQRLDPALLDSEGGHVLLPYKDELVAWEKFASGRAIHEHFSKNAGDIDPGDDEAWSYIARIIALGLVDNIAIVQPDLVIIGGSIGTYFDNYKGFLHEELKHYKQIEPYLDFPEVVKAQRPEEAVIYGCYDLAKQVYGNGGTDG